MTLATYPLNPKGLKDLELRTLKLIKDSPILSSYSANLKSDAETSFIRLDGLKKFSPNEALYNFESYLDMVIPDVKVLCRIYFGARVELTSSLACGIASYYLAVCEKESKRVLRKFHFDYDDGSGKGSRNKKPYYHLQYGGEITPLMLRDGVPVEQAAQIIHELSAPRISYMPMSLISLVAIILKEFDPEKAAQLFARSDWKAHLEKTEEYLQKEYHRLCSRKLSENKSLLLDCFYH